MIWHVICSLHGRECIISEMMKWTFKLSSTEQLTIQIDLGLCRQIAAKACFYYSMAINTAAQEKEDKRLKSLREAEALVQKEQEKGKTQTDHTSCNDKITNAISLILTHRLDLSNTDLDKRLKSMLCVIWVERSCSGTFSPEKFQKFLAQWVPPMTNTSGRGRGCVAGQ